MGADKVCILVGGVFSLYRSASLHVKTRQRVPWSAWVFLAVVVVVVSIGAPSGSRGVAPTLEALQPRLRGRPETAPLYDEVRKVVAMPGVAGCAATRTRCSCYTEQGTDVALSVDECRAWLRSPPFSPFRHVFSALAPVVSKAPVEVAVE